MGMVRCTYMLDLCNCMGMLMPLTFCTFVFMSSAVSSTMAMFFSAKHSRDGTYRVYFYPGQCPCSKEERK